MDPVGIDSSPAADLEGQTPVPQANAEAPPDPQSPKPSSPDRADDKPQEAVADKNTPAPTPAPPPASVAADVQAEPAAPQSTPPPPPPPSNTTEEPRDAQQPQHEAQPSATNPPRPVPPTSYQPPPFPYAQPPSFPYAHPPPFPYGQHLPPPQGYNPANPPPPGSYVSYAWPPPPTYAQHPPPQPQAPGYQPPPQSYPAQGPRPIQPKGLQPISPAQSSNVPPTHAPNGQPNHAPHVPPSSNGQPTQAGSYAPQYYQEGPPPPDWSSPTPYAIVSQWYSDRWRRPNAPPPRPPLPKPWPQAPPTTQIPLIAQVPARTQPPPRPPQKLINPAFPTHPDEPPAIPPPMYLPGPPNPRIPVNNALPDEVVMRTDGSQHVRKGRSKSRRLDRDQRRDILLMRRLGYQYESIAKFLGTTISAVSYTVRIGIADPAHSNAGRRIKIPPEKHEQMIKYVKEYIAAEKVAGTDKKTRRKRMAPLTYNIIRDAIFKDENGETPAHLKYTDDALKQMLNREGIWLRSPFSQTQKEQSRARGKKQWEAKLAKDREAANVSSTGDVQQSPNNREGSPVDLEDDEHDTDESGEHDRSVRQGYAEQPPDDDDDDEMGEVFSGTGSELDDDSDSDEDETEQELAMHQQLRQAIEDDPLMQT